MLAGRTAQTHTMSQVSQFWQTAVSKKIAHDARVADIQLRGEKVAEFRAYYDGDHPQNMSKEMRKLLRALRTGSEFTINHIPRIVNCRVDRCVVDQIVADNDAATQFIQAVMRASHYDRLQHDTHKGSFRDADSFVTVEYNEKKGTPIFVPEPAFDGNEGMIILYKSTLTPEIDCCVKVWAVANENGDAIADTRITVYYPNRIEKFISKGGGALEHYIDPDGPQVWPLPWVDPRTGDPLGVPVVHFPHDPFKNFGKSCIEDAIPAQDALDRSLVSLIGGSETTAFQILFALGFDPQADIVPGSVLVADKEGTLTKDSITPDLKAIAAGDLTQLIASLGTIKRELYDVTNTPMPDAVAADASGEARKQVESYLIGEVDAYKVIAGESWEQAAQIAITLQNVFGNKQYSTKTITTIWTSSETRNDADLIANANAVADKIPQEEYLRLIAPVFNWNEEKIQQMVKAKQAEQQQQLQMIADTTPTATGNSSRNAA